jgi:hypothetical protein
VDPSLSLEWLNGIRWMNTPYFPKYIWNENLVESAIQPMLESDYLIESFFYLYVLIDELMMYQSLNQFSLKIMQRK